MSGFPEGLSLILQQLNNDVQGLDNNQNTIREKVSDLKAKIDVADAKLDALDKNVNALDKKVDANHTATMAAIDQLAAQQRRTVFGWFADNPRYIPVALLALPILGSTLVAAGESINRTFDKFWDSGGDAVVVQSINQLAAPVTRENDGTQ